MAEWSTVLVLGTSYFDGMGSNPTAAKLNSSGGGGGGGLGTSSRGGGGGGLGTRLAVYHVSPGIVEQWSLIGLDSCMQHLHTIQFRGTSIIN